MDPFLREFEAIAVLLHFIPEKLHVGRIPPENEFHTRPAVGDEIDGRLRLGDEDRMVDGDVDRTDDTDRSVTAATAPAHVNVSIKSPL